MSCLILPGHPDFYSTLYNSPHPLTKEIAAKDGDTYSFVVRPGSGGLATPVSSQELDDYLDSGEYEERLEESEDELAILDGYYYE